MVGKSREKPARSFSAASIMAILAANWRSAFYPMLRIMYIMLNYMLR